jgi:hypothetical protein
MRDPGERRDLPQDGPQGEALPASSLSVEALLVDLNDGGG